MLESAEDLCVEAEGDVLRDCELLRDVDLGEGKVRAAVVVASGIAESAVGGGISTGTCASAGIDYRRKGIGVEPLAATGRQGAKQSSSLEPILFLPSEMETEFGCTTFSSTRHKRPRRGKL